MPIDELLFDAGNPRRMPGGQDEALTRSMHDFGLVQPILARREDRVVVGGHQRLRAARRLGYKSVPVIWLDVSQERARLLNLALNKISGTWDEELLARLLADLNAAPDVDLSLSGFEPEELTKSFGPSTRVTSASARRRSTSTPRWRPHKGTTRPAWRDLGVGRPSAHVRRRLRRGRSGAATGWTQGRHVLHRPSLQRRPW